MVNNISLYDSTVSLTMTMERSVRHTANLKWRKVRRWILHKALKIVVQVLPLHQLKNVENTRELFRCNCIPLVVLYSGKKVGDKKVSISRRVVAMNIPKIQAFSN